jgi:microsomal dipeptidase-like Zn-dependent dipeptidase
MSDRPSAPRPSSDHRPIGAEPSSGLARVGSRAARRRLVWSATLAAGAVVGATVMVPSYGGQSDASRSFADSFEKAATTRAANATAPPGKDRTVYTADGSHYHVDSTGVRYDDGDGAKHDHSDPATKNTLSRATGDTVTVDTTDPTTPRQAARDVAAVAAQRTEPDPQLVPVAKQADRRDVPQNRYAMAGGCYALQSTRTDRWVRRDGDGFRASAGRRSNAEPFHFQATDLGRYLLFGSARDFLAQSDSGPLGDGDTVVSAPEPSERADWVVTRSGSTYRFVERATRRGLAVDRDGTLVAADRRAGFRLRLTAGCAHWPEVRDNVGGRPFRGVSRIQEVRGLVDGHTHGMAFEFLGGDVHCGRPWHPYGVAYALKDCPDHYPANGSGAVLENILRTGSPVGTHDPVGWPTFKDWPAPRSLTHEGTYYKWMERAWRGGLRIFVNLLVENGKLCQVYPIKHNSCDDMDSIRLQARDMHRLERYVDAQYGGPGKGWYRIVTSPWQARKVINEGKLAVVMGIETSVLFGCTMKLDVPDPSCTKEAIDEQLDAVHRMGVRQMELVNKFDNALVGVAGDEGSTGVAVNSANFLETGSFWNMRTCPAAYDPEVHDKNQLAAPDPNPFNERDALFGAIEKEYGATLPVPSVPVYGSAPHCNQRGLTDLGEHTIRRMAAKHMIFDPDHMSVNGRKASLDLVERLHYPGVISSHSWSTPDAYPRIYKLGGFITPYAGDSTGFVEKWKRHLTWADPRYYFGFGYGADMNGLGAQGDPRGVDARHPVTYPFKGLGGVMVRKQHSGKRVYDINRDGVAHYGLYPDWVEDLRQLAGDRIVEDMARGPEAYLQMWERAEGVTNDACRDPRAMRRASLIRGLRRGLTARQVLLRAGQPHTRLGDAFGYCARSASGRRVHVSVLFNDSGRVRRTA